MTHPHDDPRRTRDLMTATRAGIALGLSPWGSPYRLAAEMRGEVEPEELDSPDVRRGRHLEPSILAWTADELGATTQPSSFALHPEHSWLGASNDGVYLLPGNARALAEVKCPRRKDGEWGEPGTDEVPAHYYVQTVIEMACHGIEETIVSLFVWGELVLYRVRRDLQAEQAIIEQLRDWRERYVVRGEDPPIDGSEEARSVLASRLAGRSGQMSPDADIRQRVRIIADARSRIASLEQIERREIARLQERMAFAQADEIRDPDGAFTVSWRQRKSPRKTNWQEVVSECMIPIEIVEKHTKQAAPVRYFKFSYKGENDE